MTKRFSQTAVLAYIAKASASRDMGDGPGPVALDTIAARFADAPRKRLKTLCGDLLANGFIQSSQPVGFYFITDAGRRQATSGKPITSGPRGNLKGVRKTLSGSLRERMWRALRIKQRASIPDLLEACMTDRDGDGVARNAQHFMLALHRAGIVVRMSKREPVPGSCSPGFIRYQLVNDLGPIAPVIRRDHVFDHNARQRVAFRKDQS